MDLTEEIATEPMSSFGDIFSMKVVDLKKELKARGLPITGNKTELIERLQLAQNADKGDIPGYLQLEGFEHFNAESQSNDRISGLSSGEVLTEESVFDDSLSSPEKSVKEVEKILDSPSTESSNMNRPLKKRIIATKDSNPIVGEKKLQLNRSHPVPVATSIASDVKPVSEGRKLITLASNKNGETEPRTASLKILTESERLAKRAERFNVIAVKTTTLDSSLSKATKKPITLSDSSNTADLDVLKKRAERFGQNVSTVMKQIEDKEKIMKRKLKFGTSAATLGVKSLDDQEKKKRRAERFSSS